MASNTITGASGATNAVPAKGTPAYDAHLISLVQQHNGDWSRVAQSVGGTTATVTGYYGVLVRRGIAQPIDGEVAAERRTLKAKYKPWTPKQDATLLELHKKHTASTNYGAWCTITEEMARLSGVPRTDRACQLRYFKIINRDAKKDGAASSSAAESAGPAALQQGQTGTSTEAAAAVAAAATMASSSFEMT